MITDIIKCHRLDCLFKRLPKKIQKGILKTTIEKMKLATNNQKYDDANFYDDLTNNSDIFEKWRYFYEGKCDDFNCTFISCFLKALHEMEVKQNADKVQQPNKEGVSNCTD